jgi:hypothetical protein
MIKWRHFLHPSLVVRRLGPEVERLKFHYEAKGGDFEDVLLEFVYPLRVPYQHLTGTQRKRMSRLLEGLYPVLEDQELPRYLRTSCEDLVDALLVIAFGAIDSGAMHPRARRRGRPPATASRAGAVNLIIATVAYEFRRRFGKPHWKDVRNLLCFIAPHEFPPTMSSEHFRKRADSVSDQQTKAAHARRFR